MKKSKNFGLFLIGLLILINTANAQEVFQEIIGGDNYDFGYSVHQTFDGGYIIGGMTFSDTVTGPSNCYLIKTDQTGALQWTKVIRTGLEEMINSVRQTSDSGYIMTGSTSGNYNQFNFDILVTKTDANGNIQWSKYIGDSLSQYGQSIIETSDHGFILCGNSSEFGGNPFGAVVVRLDSIGNIIWSNKYDAYEVCFDIQETPNGDFVIGGNYLDGNLFVIKIDGAGNLLMNKSYNSLGEMSKSSLIQTNDNGFVLFGTGSLNGMTDFNYYLMKTDSSGNFIWGKSYGGLADEFGFSAKQTRDGGFILAGNSQSLQVSVNGGYVVKTDSVGNTIWSKSYSGGDNEEIFSIDTTNDNGFIFTGRSNSFANRSLDIYIVKTDSLGNSGCNDFDITTFAENNVSLSATDHPQVTPVTFTSINANYTVAGFDSTIVLCNATNIFSPDKKDGLEIYPNPSTGKFSISLPGNYSTATIQIINSIGEIVYVSMVTSQTSKQIDLKNLPDGIYFVNVISGHELMRGKIVVVRD